MAGGAMIASKESYFDVLVDGEDVEVSRKVGSVREQTIYLMRKSNGQRVFQTLRKSVQATS